MNQEFLNNFNGYINQEFYTSYMYYAMSTYFDEIMMQGFSTYMKHLASKDLAIAQKMYDYLILRDEKLQFLKIEEPFSSWVDVTDVFVNALEQEKQLFESIKNLYLLAKQKDDIGAMEFVKEILNQKLKSVSIAKKVVFRVKNSKIMPIGVEFMDILINRI